MVSRPHRNLDSKQHTVPALLRLSFQVTVAYSPYGYCAGESRVNSVVGFKGEWFDPFGLGYMLGNGYRMFGPTLMRFGSPDSMSPFGKGGLNGYCFCKGDPVNRMDPSGHWPLFPENFRFGRYRRVVMQSYQGSRRSMTRRPSMPALPVRPSDDEIRKNWDMIAYHGGAAQSKKGLQTNLDPIFQGGAGREDFGAGFYGAPRLDIPVEVARGIQKNDKRDPMIYSVYTEHIARLRPGRDFDFTQLPEYPTHRKEMEMVFRTAAYSMLVVREGRPGRIVLPRSKEAPF